MKENLLGIDVGGTKCAIIYGIKENDELHIIDKKKFDTTTVDETIDRILCETEKMMNLHQLTPTNTKAIGICCGGPLNSETGIVMSPPNLPMGQHPHCGNGGKRRALKPIYTMMPMPVL